MKNSMFLILIALCSNVCFAQVEPKVEEVVIEKINPDKTHNQKVIKIVINGDKEKYKKMQIEVDGNAIKINGKASTKLDSIDVYVFENNIVEHRINKRGLKNNDESHSLLDEYGWGVGNEKRQRLLNVISGGYLGITMEKKENGIAIIDIAKQSAAEKAGLLSKDIITKIDGLDMTGLMDITNYIAKQKKGTEITIDYIRDGKNLKTKTILEGRKQNDLLQRLNGFKNEDLKRLMPMEGMYMPEMPPMQPMPPMQHFDFKFEEMPNVKIYKDGVWNNFSNTPKLGLSLKETESGNGLEVTTVEENSVAAKAGLLKGDIITSVANITTKDIKDVKKVVLDNKENAFDIIYLRNGKAGKVEIKLPKQLKEVVM